MNRSRRHDDGLDAETAERLLSGEGAGRFPRAEGTGLLRGEGVPEEDAGVADLAGLLARAGERQDGRPEDELVVLAHFRQRRAERHGRKAQLFRATIGGVVAVCAFAGVAVATQQAILPPLLGPGVPGTPGTDVPVTGHHRQKVHQPAPQIETTHPLQSTRPTVSPAPAPGDPSATGPKHASHSGEGGRHGEHRGTPPRSSHDHSSRGKSGGKEDKGHTGGSGSGSGGDGIGGSGAGGSGKSPESVIDRTEITSPDGALLVVQPLTG